ncbi:cystatin-2-like [Gastrophryne carolinensis]
MAAGSILVVVLSVISVYVSCDLTAGGQQRVDPSDPNVVKAARFAINGFNQQSKNEYKYKLMNILSADEQIVEGVIYTLNVQMGKTDCRKDSTMDIQTCSLMQKSNTAKTLFCTFKVLEVPWEHVESLLSYSCKAN